MLLASSDVAMLQKEMLLTSSDVSPAAYLNHCTIFEEEYEEPCIVEDSKSIRAGGLTVMMNLKCEPFSNCF